MEIDDRTALVVIDVQRGFDDAVWGRRNNPSCEDNVARLIAAWRAAGRPLVYVRHDSREPASPLRPGQPGNDFKDVVTGEPDVLVAKHVNSAFLGTPDLEAWLRERGITALVLCGIQTNYCVETTARVAGNLGYRTFFVLDATHAFDQPDLEGGVISADELARVTASTLHGEFATVVSTAEVLAAGERGRANA